MAASSSSLSSHSSSSSDSSSHRRRRHHRSHRDRDKEALTVRKKTKSHSKRRRRHHHSSDSYSSSSISDYSRCESSFESEHDTSHRSKRHKRNERSKKNKEKDRSKSHRHKRQKHKVKELGSVTCCWALDWLAWMLFHDRVCHGNGSLIQKQQDERSSSPVQLSKFLGRDKDDGVRRSAVSGKKKAEKVFQERIMEGIQHRRVEVNGIKMHVAEKGEGPVVLFLHGFPELWYSWRHQIVALSSLGYRAVAPDLRGYGETEGPDSISSYSCFHLVGDLVALIDTLGVGEQQVFVVGHDWGAILGWYLCLFRPERVKAYVCLSVPFRPFLGRNPQIKTVDAFRALYGDDFYICRFQEPGKMEAQIAEAGTAYVLKNILTTRQTGPPILPKGEYGTGFNPDTPQTLPSWLSQQELDYYVTKFENTGFSGGLNYYRNLNLDWELTAGWTGVGVNVAVKFIVGELDLVYTAPGMKEYIHGDGFKKDVPNLKEVVVQKGVAHFNNQEAAEEVSNHIYDFINKF